MSRTRFGIQATLVITAILLVSWPEFRPMRAASVWRYTPEELRAAETLELETYRYADETRTARPGTGSASFSASIAAAAAARRREDGTGNRTLVVPLEVLQAGGSVNAVMGRARTSLNTPIPYARVLLRNIRTGAIEARATANEEGRYTFLDVAASAYVVELLGPDGSVVAASEMVAMAPGSLRETTVRVAANAFATAASFGGRLTGTLDLQGASALRDIAQDAITRTSNTLTEVANVSPVG